MTGGLAGEALPPPTARCGAQKDGQGLRFPQERRMGVAPREGGRSALQAGVR